MDCACWDWDCDTLRLDRRPHVREIRPDLSLNTDYCHFLLQDKDHKDTSVNVSSIFEPSHDVSMISTASEFSILSQEEVQEEISPNQSPAASPHSVSTFSSDTVSSINGTYPLHYSWEYRGAIKRIGMAFVTKCVHASQTAQNLHHPSKHQWLTPIIAGSSTPVINTFRLQVHLPPVKIQPQTPLFQKRWLLM